MCYHTHATYISLKIIDVNVLYISGLLNHYSTDHPDYRDCKGE